MNAHNRVMFVDDEEGVRASWDRLLSEHGFQVTTAMDGRRAVSELQDHPVDVIVADWKMPVMDGIELLEWVKDEQPETRFILLTGYGNDEVERKVRDLGAYDYLNKPISPETLAAIVAEAASRPDFARAMPAAIAVPAAAVEPVEELVEEAQAEAEPESGGMTLKGTLKVLGGLVAAPILGLAFVIALPVIGFGAFAWYVGQAVARLVRPAATSA